MVQKFLDENKFRLLNDDIEIKCAFEITWSKTRSLYNILNIIMVRNVLRLKFALYIACVRNEAK